MEDLAEEVTCEQRPEGDEGTSPEDTWGQSIAGRGNSKFPWGTRTEVTAWWRVQSSKDVSRAAGEEARAQGEERPLPAVSCASGHPLLNRTLEFQKPGFVDLQSRGTVPAGDRTEETRVRMGCSPFLQASEIGGEGSRGKEGVRSL